MEGKFYTVHLHHNGVAYEGHGKTPKAAHEVAYKRAKKALGDKAPKAEDMEKNEHEMYGPLPRSMR